MCLVTRKKQMKKIQTAKILKTKVIFSIILEVNLLTFYLDQPFSHKCRCSRVRQTNMMTNCPSDGCLEYIKILKKKYGLRYDEIGWTYLKCEDFIIGPLYAGEICEDMEIKTILRSESSIVNSIMYVKKAGPENTYFYPKDRDWKMFSCKYCQMWLFAAEGTKN